MAIHSVSHTPVVLPPLRLHERAPTHIQLPSIHELCPDYDHKMPPRAQTHTPYVPCPRPTHRSRQDSISSSSSSPSPPPMPQQPAVRVVLVTNWDEADAALVLHPSSDSSNRPQLLLGDRFARFKAAGFPTLPGGRAWPYRVQRVALPTVGGTRRPSVIVMTQ
ncbi:hypothetical protein K488DRAFT_85888 [Vararia minispora EC-137]|uniref:Uncharacterized protein n=1 Tax=Vararia minispora EC-137 TaxID=1314806 RepID=A0ACB8QM37_9AGAM|nr:hypothetical protein K488DRAFT_85888 [Vararia minispora EC-137]